MTVGNIVQQKRCGQPLLSQTWGPKFSPNDILTLEAEVRNTLKKDLAGVGLFTLDGVLAQEPGKKKRYWNDALCLLNKVYKIPCSGAFCCPDAPPPTPAAPTPPPSPATPTPPPSPAAPTPQAPTPAAPTPKAPTPPPTPLSTMYTCSFMTGSPPCKLDPAGWTDKAGCEKVCQPPKPTPKTPTPKAPTPKTPTPPVPTPAGLYMCDWTGGVPTCKIDAAGWGPLDDCKAVCHTRRL